MQKLSKEDEQFFYRYYGYKKKTHDTPYGPINIRKSSSYYFKDKMFDIAHPKARHYYADVCELPLNPMPEEKKVYRVLIRHVANVGFDGIVFKGKYKTKDLAIKKAAFLLSTKFKDSEKEN